MRPPATQGEWLARLRAAGPQPAVRWWKAFQSVEADGACRQAGPARGTVSVAASLALRDGTTAAIGIACQTMDASGCLSAVADAATALAREVARDFA